MLYFTICPRELFCLSSFHAAGEIHARVLGNDVQENSARCKFLRHLLEWAGAGDVEPSVADACQFLQKLQKCASTLPPLAEITDRFQTKLVSVAMAWATRTWKDVGPKGVEDGLSKCGPLPRPLEPVLHLAKHADFLLNLKLPTEPEPNLSQLTQLAKSWFTLQTFDQTVMNKFLPQDDIEKQETFSDTAVDFLDRRLQQAKSACNNIKATVDKYRPGVGLVLQSSVKNERQGFTHILSHGFVLARATAHCWSESQQLSQSRPITLKVQDRNGWVSDTVNVSGWVSGLSIERDADFSSLFLPKARDRVEVAKRGIWQLLIFSAALLIARDLVL